LSHEEAFASKIKIIEVLRRSTTPLIAQHIAKRTHLSAQLVSYHLSQMVDLGMVIASNFEERTIYQLQNAYYDERLLEDLSVMLIPYMQKMSKGMDFSQVKVSDTEAVTRNLFMFLRLFEMEIEKSSRTVDMSTPNSV